MEIDGIFERKEIMSSTTLKDKDVRIKKDQKCAWCSEKIYAGDHANYRVYIFDGFQYDYMHIECKMAMGSISYNDRHFDWYWDEGFEFGEFFRGETRSRNE